MLLTSITLSGHLLVVLGGVFAAVAVRHRDNRAALLGTLLAVVAHSLIVIWRPADDVWMQSTAVLRNLSLLGFLYGLFAREGRLVATPVLRLVFVSIAVAMILHGIGVHYTGPGDFAGNRTSRALELLGSVGMLFLLHNLYSGATTGSRSILAWSAGCLTAFWMFGLNAATIAFATGSEATELVAAEGFATMFAVAAVAALPADERLSRPIQTSRKVAVQLASLLLVLLYFMSIAIFWAVADGKENTFLRSSQIGLGLIGMAAASFWIVSARSREWLKVFIAKHFFQHRYDYRYEWMRFTEALAKGGAADELESRAIRALAQITESRGGLLLRPDDDDRLVVAGDWRWDRQPSADELAWFRTLQRTRSADWVEDFAELAPPVGWAEAWAAVPLLHDRRVLGFAVLSAPATPRPLDWEDIDLLKVTARQIASHIAEQSSLRSLEDGRKFEEFNRRMAFVMHDVKNLSSQLSLLVGNAERHIDNPAFRADMLVTLRASSDRLNALLERLGRYGEREATQNAEVNLTALAARLAGTGQGVELKRSAGGPVVVLAEAEALQQALEHLIANARDASADDAPVLLELGHDGLRGQIVVADTGTGMSAQFVRRELFKPFASTKNGGFGIGAHEARTLIRAMGGRMDVDSREGVGTRVTVSLPLASAASHKERQVA